MAGAVGLSYTNNQSMGSTTENENSDLASTAPTSLCTIRTFHYRLELAVVCMGDFLGVVCGDVASEVKPPAIL